MPPLVSVVIANWNGRCYMEKCLASLNAQTYPSLEIIVVDNGSADGSRDWLVEHYPAVQVIANKENRGFAVANNQGISRSRGVYVALLNNDAWAEPDWLSCLVAAVEQDPNIGMAASLMLLADQPERVDSAGACVDRFGISWDRLSGEPAAASAASPAPVFGASAGAALYRRQLLDQTAGFDEDFFNYLEDVDLAWRALWLGWRAVYEPAARVYHVHSGTSGAGSAFKTYWLARNKIGLILKNYPRPQLWYYWPLILLYDGLSLGAALLAPQRWSALRGRLDGWRLLGRTLAKRRALQAMARVPAAEVFRRLAPPATPWQVRHRFQHRAGPGSRAWH